MDTPFGSRRPGAVGRVRAGVIGAGFLLAVAYVAWQYTREPGGASGIMIEPQHGMVASGDSLRPVMLSEADQRRIGVTFATAVRMPVEREVRVVAQILADESRLSVITLKVDGWVEQLHVDRTGQWVDHDDPLITVYSPMLVSAQAEYLVASRLHDSIAPGHGRAGAAELREAARRRLAFWGVPDAVLETLDATGVPQRSITLAAPTHGVVMEKLVVAGQRVIAGEPLYRIADLSAVWLEGDVFEQDLALVRPGLQASVELEALAGERFTGRVASIAPKLDPATRTARVRVELPNPSLRLKPGMYGTMRLFVTTPPEVTIPRSAVLVTGNRALVFVRDVEGRLVPREVRLGSASADRIAILAGLDAGEVVVASATFLIDAESNLAAGLGGMANMPGMDMPMSQTAPKAPASPPAMKAMPGMEGMPGMRPDSGRRKAPGGADAHSNH